MPPEWIEVLFGILLDSSIRISVVAAIVALILAMSRIRSSDCRHAAWTAVLCAMLLMPVLPYWVPSIAVPLPVWIRSVEVIPAASQTLLPFPGVQSRTGLHAPIGPAPSHTVAEPETKRFPIWPIAALTTYVIGVLILLARLLVGWREMRGVVVTSRPIASCTRTPWPGARPVRESSQVVTALTAGVISPTIILPVMWRSWPEEKLHAILVHEYAHIKRRDPVVGFLAHVNRCVFWFHPLAWWLERRLAATAEDACDDAAVRAIGAARRYAEILLDMAETVRRQGGRLSRQGVGVRGNGLLGQRIDRILRGDLLRQVSATRKSVLALSCAAVIFFVAACRQGSVQTQTEPDVRQQADRTSEWLDRHFELSPQEVLDLEASLEKNPEDLTTRMKLLNFYRRVFSGKKVDGLEKMIAARRPHILWLIRHHPEYPDYGKPLELVNNISKRTSEFSAILLDPIADPAGYAEAKRLWLAHAERPNVSGPVLSNASFFFEASDKPLAEKALLRAQALHPGKPWFVRLGRLYVLTLIGSNAFMISNVADVHTAYAEEIRRKLAESTDDKLLTAAGMFLMRTQELQLDFDPFALGKSYLERAVQVNPQTIEANATLIALESVKVRKPILETLRDVPKEAKYKAVSALPEAERFQILLWLAEYASGEGDSLVVIDPGAAKAAWERAQLYAQDLLKLAPKFHDHPHYGKAFFGGNITLGIVAMRNGDKAGALKYLRQASRSPGSKELMYSSCGLWSRLCGALLKSGEREPVAEFLERLAELSAEKDYLLESAAAIRKGRATLYP
jgi:beta-lactamase regulating signal transducer with metallopeptidase domain